MKLASLKHTNRDGRLIVVSRDLKKATYADSVAPTLQAALDQWPTAAPELEKIYGELNAGKGLLFDLDVTQLTAPLPRAYQWADGSAYVTHVELVRKARGAVLPDNFWTDPLMYQGGSDGFIGARDPILVESEDAGIDFESELAIITDDVPMAIPPKEAASHIKLLMLVNDVSLRNLIPNELSKGFGFFHSKPATAFSPVAITPDELEEAWDGARVHLPMTTHLNGAVFGTPNAGVDMTFGFPELISHAAKTRFLSAGTIIGSGTIANADRSVGSSCIAERRMLEKLNEGEPKTAFMKFGDRVRIEMKNAAGDSLFGAIDQQVVQYTYQRSRLSA